VSHTAARLLLGLLGLGLLLPLGLSLLDQALLACVLMFNLCALRGGVERRLVVNTVNNTGDESRVAEDLSIRRWSTSNLAWGDLGIRCATHVDTLASHFCKGLRGTGMWEF